MKFKKNLKVKILSCVLAAALLSGGIEAYAAMQTADSAASSSGGDVQKEETVYVIANADGNVREVIVSDWLKNPKGQAQLTDKTELKDIKNVKGDESFSVNGDGITVWDAQGNDIYYQGTTDKKLPVEVSVSYFLNSEKISPDELAGKSGTVKIRFDYKNNEKRTITVDGESTEVYVPFLTATGMLLDNDSFKNIRVTNGKVINDGSRSTVIGFALPGMKESLGIEASDKAEIPEYVEVTADVTSFSVSESMTVAAADILRDVNLDDTADLSELTGSLGKLGDAANQLSDGSCALYAGLCELLSKSDGLIGGISQLKSGADSLQTGADSLFTGASQLNAGSGRLSSNMHELVGGLSTALGGADGLLAGYAQVQAGIGDAKDGVKALSGGADALSEGIEYSCSALSQTVAANEQVLADLEAMYAAQPSQEVQTMIQTLKTTLAGQKKIVASMTSGGVLMDGASALKNGCIQLMQGTDALAQGIEGLRQGTSALHAGIAQAYVGSVQLDDGAKELYSATAQLEQGAGALASGSGTLRGGISALQSGGKTLIGGISELKNGSETLSSGMNEFNETGIKKLVEAFDGDMGKLIERLRALKEVSEEYQSFSGKAEGMCGSVKFIYKTAGI